VVEDVLDDSSAATVPKSTVSENFTTPVYNNKKDWRPAQTVTNVGLGQYTTHIKLIPTLKNVSLYLV
jgi:hypothetical protein